MSDKASCLLVADFTVDTLGACLDNDASEPSVSSSIAPFDNVIPVLGGAVAEVWDEAPDYAVVWTQPGSVVPSFAALASFENVASADIAAETEQFADLVLAAAERVRALFVPTWTRPVYERGGGILDMHSEAGVARALMEMNLRLADKFAGSPNVHLLNADRWMMRGGSNATNPKLAYAAKVPFSNAVFKEAALDIKAAIGALTGLTRKLVVVDLDDTLWGGIVGDVGWEHLALGGHDAVGEAYVDFQRRLKNLTRRGILLAVVSKNEESVALEAIDRHPEMVLRRDDFSAWRINWEDKARNLSEIADELNLGLQSIVFIDDNPVERGRVSEALPEVLVPDWPSDPLLYPSTLAALRGLDAATLSEEDRKRTAMYAAERGRASLKTDVGSLDDWLASLEINVRCEALSEANLKRATQLLNKTNQMNLSTRRMTEQELTEWSSQEGNFFLTFRVSDRFGDSGLTGLASLACDRDTARVTDFVLSCRVMGRKIEETMMHKLIDVARAFGASELTAEYLPTPKNKPCLGFFERSGLSRDGDVFTWQLSQDYPAPAQVELDVSAAA